MYNRVILMGRLTRDPEMSQTQSGIAMCRFGIAVDRFARKGEERQSDFFDIVAWRQQAEFVNRFFSKGRCILVEGRLQNDNYVDKNGVQQYRTRVVADAVSFTGEKRQDSTGGSAYGTPNPYQPATPFGQQQNYTAPTPQQVPQAPQASVPQQPVPTPAIELGNVDEFGMILSDGDVPF